jgi:hypothetical protein
MDPCLRAIPARSAYKPPSFLSDSLVFEWGNLTLRAEVVFMVAIAVCLGCGLVSGHPAAGMIAAGGAMTVGLGAKQNIDDSPLLPMIFVSLGMAVSIFIGMVAGHTNGILVPIAALWGLGYGMISKRPSGYVWVALQCVVTLLVASAFPFSPKDAAVRAALILAGGAVQILITSLVLQSMQKLREDLLAVARYVRTEQLLLRVTMLETARSLGRDKTLPSSRPYAIRLAVILAVGTEIYRLLHFASGYWIPMTALLVLKPGLSDTASRAIARTVGTLAGAVLASFFIAHLIPVPVVLAGMTVLFAWLAYSTLNVNYALFSVFLTAYIVFLLALASVPGKLIAERRAACTAIGGALALAIRLVVLYHRKKQRAEHPARSFNEEQPAVQTITPDVPSS